ncbi:MAG: FAD binding domain-containing protein [Paracoccaceae bacterium]|nr:FAD binding domain-containing protein [Paracoccaceae bacterium]MDE2915973.1 FAD binding domain-containing protein [Paracoccaceae bacterium]
MVHIFPENLSSALASMEVPAKVIAGCTDFYPSLENGHVPDRIVDVSKVDEMVGITKSTPGWRIGGSTTWTEIIDHPFPPAFDGLKAAAREVGSIQIQNSGTIAGNICNASPAADGIPPLLTLEAMVEVQSANSTRLVNVEDFVLGPRKVDLGANELVTAIWVPETRNNTTSSFLKLGSRKYLVISIAMVAVTLSISPQGLIEFLNIAVGSCSPVARRMPVLEKKLTGLRARDILDDIPVEVEDLTGLTPITDIRGTSEYRQSAVRELCQSTIRDAIGKSLEIT